MLQIQNIRKQYKTGPLTQQALDGVSLSLRDSEFVAILGPSGSGKTTLLNVIGGLDHYDEGDLIINGVSTKKYGSRDWDAYRNHTVGFVFQSYNLIPHQTILANVELALTISGISRGERASRAKNALIQVGLEEHMHKKPSQLSGGQMQRVAIARALVNDPDILLADEPTGALDSDTSLQVMDLLKEVSRDRLVVMVTHNPELAEQYATRIVTLRDGRITSDSDPFEPPQEEAVHKRLGKASMSFLTALTLSFNNLWTKKVRTLLVAFAGSIGIIGIAMILSMSNGVDLYIQSVEEDTLKSYPLQITDTSFNLASFVPQNSDEEGEDAGQVREWRTVTNLFSRVTSNDLKSLRAFIESGESDIYDHVQAIEYGYNLTPQIYAVRRGNVRKVNPDNTFAALGFTSAEGSTNSLLSAFSNTDTFRPMPREPSLYESQYDVKAGHWPQNDHECVVVLTPGGRISDMTLYVMGIKDPQELDDMVRAFAAGSASPTDGEEKRYRYEDLLGIGFKLIHSSDYYVYDAEHGVWVDRSEDERHIRTLADDAETMTIVGVVQPKEDATSPALTRGIAYPAALIDHLMEVAADSPVVKAQLASPGINVFTGEAFGVKPQGNLDMASLFSFDESALRRAFAFDADALQNALPDLSGMDLSGMDLSGIDWSSMIDPSAFSPEDLSLPELSQEDLAALWDALQGSIDPGALEDLPQALLADYTAATGQEPAQAVAQLPTAMGQYLLSEELREALRDGIVAIVEENTADLLTPDQIGELVRAIVEGYPAYLQENGLDDGDVPFRYLDNYLQAADTRQKLQEVADALRAQLAALEVTPQQWQALSERVIQAYGVFADENGLPDPVRLGEDLAAYLTGDRAQALIMERLAGAVDAEGAQAAIAALADKYSAALGERLSAAMQPILEQIGQALADALTDRLTGLMEQVSGQLRDAFSFDADALKDAFSMKMDPEELRDLMTSMMSRDVASLDGNLRKLGYADEEKPATVTIYPLDFPGKTAIKNILNTYNDRQSAAGHDEKVIVYTDMVDTLMSSVTDIVDAISGVLIAFVAISLVVSSVMIGVITYISVLERKKEIGILRAIGASKRNISEVFNAETFIIGALAGLLGVGITWLLIIPTNAILRSLTGMETIRAFLPVSSALILVALSIVLTLIGGIIPSRKAARSDPVAALRSE
ncbi:MAG: ATP-binding cassette domain-containing protein [Acutalibacteraceae bacterium]|jgi:putative ABC transport system permease protein